MTVENVDGERERVVDDGDDFTCARGYYEHQERVTHRDEDGTTWECTRCGADGYDPVELTDDVVLALAAEAEAGYDIEQLTARQHDN